MLTYAIYTSNLEEIYLHHNSRLIRKASMEAEKEPPEDALDLRYTSNLEEIH
jgi:hypothetical protein